MEKARHTHPFPVTVKEMTIHGRGFCQLICYWKHFTPQLCTLNLKQSGSCGCKLELNSLVSVTSRLPPRPSRWVGEGATERTLLLQTLYRGPFKLKITLNSWKRKSDLSNYYYKQKIFKITAYALKYMLWMSMKEGCQTLGLQVFTYNIYRSRTFKK